MNTTALRSTFEFAEFHRMNRYNGKVYPREDARTLDSLRQHGERMVWARVLEVTPAGTVADAIKLAVRDSDQDASTETDHAVAFIWCAAFPECAEARSAPHASLWPVARALVKTGMRDRAAIAAQPVIPAPQPAPIVGPAGYTILRPELPGEPVTLPELRAALDSATEALRFPGAPGLERAGDALRSLLGRPLRVDVAGSEPATIWNSDGTKGPVLICPPPTQQAPASAQQPVAPQLTPTGYRAPRQRTPKAAPVNPGASLLAAFSAPAKVRP